MNLNPWRDESLRFLAICLLIPITAAIVGHAWKVATFILLFYISFLLFKIYILHSWLNNGMPDESTPHSTGIFEHIVALIYLHKKASEKATREQKALTEQFHETLSAIPSATVILNKDNEIEWANYASLSLLGINGQSDRGFKVDTLWRQPKFVDFLGKNTCEQIEIQSPVSPEQTLAVQTVPYAERRRLLLAHNMTLHMEVQRSRKTFIANASHELRTPLTVVAGYLEFMQSDPKLPNSLKTPIDNAIKQSNQMEILINDLLVLSKLEDKALKPKHLSTITLATHLSATMQTLVASGKTKKHDIRASCKNKSLCIEANEKELNSVCYNFINNAIKYSEEDSQIKVKWERLSDTHVKFSVSDNGIGIAPEHIAHLTERFYRVDSGRSKRVGGTGLGLSIVKHILEHHNGRLEIHSTLGEGSTFSAIFLIHPLESIIPS